jgi:hypothetical protein
LAVSGDIEFEMLILLSALKWHQQVRVGQSGTNNSLRANLWDSEGRSPDLCDDGAVGTVELDDLMAEFVIVLTEAGGSGDLGRDQESRALQGESASGEEQTRQHDEGECLESQSWMRRG